MRRTSEKAETKTKATRRRKVKTVEEVSRDKRASLSSDDSDSFLQDERFDVMPKTDYTYARTGSYSPRFLGRKWVNPNMSRYRIHGNRSGSAEGEELDEGVQYLEYSDDEDEVDSAGGVNVTDTDTDSYTTVNEDGMLLRSGHSLRSLRSVIRSHDSEGRRSLATDMITTTTTTRIITETLSDPRVNRHSSFRTESIDTNMNDNAMRKKQSSRKRSESSSSNADSYSGTVSGRYSRTNTDAYTRRSRDTYDGSQSSSGSQTNGGIYTDSYSASNQRELRTSTPAYSIRKVRKTLTQDFDDIQEAVVEKGSVEQSEKLNKSRLTRSGSKSVRHGYGLDSEEEFSDSGSSSYTKNSTSRYSDTGVYSDGGIYSRGAARYNSSNTSVTTTVITTVTETISTVTSPVLGPVWTRVLEPVCRPIWQTVGAPVWRYVGEPIWRHIGQPIASTIATILFILWFSVCDPVLCVVESVVSTLWSVLIRPVTRAVLFVPLSLWNAVENGFLSLVVTDAWLFKRRRRQSCCLCLPLLLLLPLLFGLFAGSGMIVSRSDFLGLWSGQKEAFKPGVNMQENNLYLTQLNEEVRKVIIQLQQGQQSQLTAAQVEQIVRGMLDKDLLMLKLSINGDLSALKQGLNGDINALKLGAKEDVRALKADVDGTRNEEKLSQIQWKAEQAAQLESMKQQYADLTTSIQNLQMSIDNQKQMLNEQGDQLRTESGASLAALEQRHALLLQQLGDLDQAHKALVARVNACCHNESYYAAAINHQVSLILAEMMAGQASGNAGQDSFTNWLHSNYVSRDILEKRLNGLATELTASVMAMMKESQAVYQSTAANVGASDTGGVGVQQVRLMIGEALSRYAADKTGLPDFALESAGGTVVSTRCSETYYRKTALVSVFGIPLWYTSNSPRTVIQPDVNPGQCWAFRGTQGYLVIQMVTTVTPTGFTLEHIPKSLAPTGEIDSAPKEFSVSGLQNEFDTKGVNLGNYTYNDEGTPIQYFPVRISNPQPFNMVELKIHSNYGNVVYTCLYRFRIHGKPYKP